MSETNQKKKNSNTPSSHHLDAYSTHSKHSSDRQSNENKIVTQPKTSSLTHTHSSTTAGLTGILSIRRIPRMPTASFLHTPVSYETNRAKCRRCKLITMPRRRLLLVPLFIRFWNWYARACFVPVSLSSLSRLAIGSEVLLGFHLRGFTFVSCRVSGLCSTAGLTNSRCVSGIESPDGGRLSGFGGR